MYAVSFIKIEQGTIHGPTKALEILGYAVLLGIALSGVGGLFGFLFGVPRTRQSENWGSRPTSGQPDNGGYNQFVNTNLEQISDWLTKILIGVGLTELKNIPGGISALAYGLKFGLNDSQPLTTILILNFLIGGFFVGYLSTRLFLAGALFEADTATAIVKRAIRELDIERNEAALSRLNEKTPTRVRQHIYEQLTFSYLYRPAPEGFTKAIEYASGLIEKHEGTARLWAYLALAYGQQFAWEMERGRGATAQKARDHALEAVREAIHIDSEMKAVFQMTWDPESPARTAPDDNDLEVFFLDQDFKKELLDGDPNEKKP